jgi:hypothetical protein
VEQVLKKSLVSVPGRSVSTAQRRTVVGAEDAQAAHQHRHLRGAQGEQVRAVEQQVLAGSGCPGAGSCGTRPRRLQRGEGLDVGPLLRASVRPGERDLELDAALRRGLLDRRGPAQHDQVGERDRLAEACPISSSGEHLRQLGGLLTSTLRPRRMRAPFAPPRLSPRNVDADAHAVETSWATIARTRGSGG